MSRRPRQIELAHRRWGARKHRGGRPVGPNPRIRHRSRPPFAGRFPCHVTLKVREDVPSLRSVKLVAELEGTFARGCERGEFRLVHYSLQGDHAHLLVEAKDRRSLGRGMKSLGARLARAVNRVFGRSGPVLRDRYHLRVLRTPREVRNALAYVLLKARRHAAKAGRRLSAAVRVDPASSGRWFDGWKTGSGGEEAGRSPPPARPPVSAPHTWLLSVGWRRGGLIDPAEIPGGAAA